VIVTSIYLLSDPATGAVRYVGKTVMRWRKRLTAHINDARSGRLRHHCANWIRSLGSASPVLTVVEEVHGLAEDGLEVERRWIARLRAEGSRLTNLTDGGQGMTGYVHAPESKAKIGAKSAGRTLGPESRAKISAANKGRKHTEEARQKMAASQTGRKWSEATREKMKDRKHSPEVRAKIGAAHRGRPKSEAMREKLRRPHSPEHVEKCAAAHRGLKHSVEARAKMRAAHLARSERVRSGRAA
jgi:hypothetical protein